MATQIDLAFAEFRGFKHGKQSSNNIVGMIIAMGLTKKEWEKMKIIEDIGIYLEPDEITEINKYFESKK